MALFKSGNAPHINNIQLGATERYRTNVWDYQGMNSFGAGRMDNLGDHPTAKPAAMIADAIRDATNRGDVVLDTFAGSGTLLIAAERTRRRARCMELDPRYVDVALQRFSRRFGAEATLHGTGQSFDAVRAERQTEQASEASIDVATPHRRVRQRTRPTAPVHVRTRAG